jgi:hypothetical protein
MIKAAFIILRVLVAIGALLGFAGSLAVILFTNIFKFVKDGVGIFAAVVTTFASGFQKSPSAPEPGLVFSLPIVGLAVTFAAIFASVFMPGQKIFLHIVAAMSIAAFAWEIWRISTNPQAQAIYWPVIALWFLYYGICLRRA